MYLRKKSAFIGALFTVTSSIFAQSSNAAFLVTMDGYDCLPLSTFGLAGLRLWDSKDTVEKTLGKPLSITSSSGEDDGGRYEIIIYNYSNLKVDIVRGKIDRIYTTSSSQSTPEGIRVGDRKETVISKLGKYPRDWTESQQPLSIVSCPVNGEWIQEDYVTYIFKNDRLKSIAYEANRP